MFFGKFKNKQKYIIEDIILKTRKGKEILCLLTKKSKQRTVRIRIQNIQTVLISAPITLSTSKIKSIIDEKIPWIEKKLTLYESLPVIHKKEFLGTFNDHKQSAHQRITELILRANAFYGYKYNSITIKSQKNIWGSCSKRGDLNFNYKIVHLPEHLAYYIVVHELCHLQEFNHSTKFWDLVEKTVPNHRLTRRELALYGLAMA